MCISSSADDPPEPHRLEPVGVQGREVDDRVSGYLTKISTEISETRIVKLR